MTELTVINERDEQPDRWSYRVRGETDSFVLYFVEPKDHDDAARLVSENYFLYGGGRGVVREGFDVDVMVIDPQGQCSFHRIQWVEEIICRAEPVVPKTNVYDELAQYFGITRESAKSLLWARHYGMGIQRLKGSVRKTDER